VPDYRAEFAAAFAAPINLAPLVGQDNLFRLIPLRALLIRLGRGASAWDAERMLTAARVIGCPVHVSAAEGAVWHAALGVPVAVEPPETLAASLERLSPEPERVRVSGAIADVLLEACQARGWHVDDTPVAIDARTELLKYLREQAISIDWHRHGNLGDRDGSGEHA
jgi:RHH-type proline utilization regulon transcriptional repressor/proline dehydrogenase/delta 1-pyrroline-5-carboxylate dehydrogenase